MEHPTVIPMDLPSSHQEPRGPMTRARARALENEVTSFLSDIIYDPLETWLLPKSDMVCMIRCQEEPPEDAREDGQATKFMDEENRRKEKKTAPGPGHAAPAPDIRPLETSTTAAAQPAKYYRARTSGPMPGHPAPPESPEIRPLARTSDPANPESTERSHASPDIRHLLKARTSSPSRAPGYPALLPEIWTPPIQRATRPAPPAQTFDHPARTFGPS